MFKQLLAIILLSTISFACAGEAKAQIGSKLFKHCNEARYQRATYNANLLAYKERYTAGWVAGYRGSQGLSYQRPAGYPTTPTTRYYSTQPVYQRQVVHGTRSF